MVVVVVVLVVAVLIGPVTLCGQYDQILLKSCVKHQPTSSDASKEGCEGIIKKHFSSTK